VSLILNKIKEDLIENLDIKHIDKSYKKVFTHLVDEIKSLS
jgi:hypothetical protein